MTYPLTILFDLETTSKKPSEARVWQIAAKVDDRWLKLHGHTAVEAKQNSRHFTLTSITTDYNSNVFETTCKPECEMPADATAVHHTSDHDLLWKFGTERALRDFWKWCETTAARFNTHSVLLVGHNAISYDRIVMWNEMKQYGVEMPNTLQVKFSDTMIAYRRCFYMKPGESVSLSEIARRRGVMAKHEEQKHEALADVMLVQGILDKAPEVDVVYEALIHIAVDPPMEKKPNQFIMKKKEEAPKSSNSDWKQNSAMFGKIVQL